MRADIEKRVRRLPVRAGRRTFSTDGKCLICGKVFKTTECPHNVTDNEIAIDAVYAKDLLE